MALISQESIDRVRESADIVEVVGQKTDLRRRGDRWVGLCPFHDERTPSFSVNAEEKLYYCFGCQAGGNLFRFVEETEGVDFAGAVESLAERYGIELEYEESDPKADERRRRRSRMHEVLERAASFYEAHLWESPKAAKIREYLLGRGLSEEALREFGVGMAPAGFDSLLVKGQQAGFSVEELISVGLVRRGRRGPYDHFRRRIMFPLRDSRGRVVGFGGRKIDETDTAKYVNSPEGELFHKSRLLYGFDLARRPIAKAGRAIVVEGYTDVIAAHQAGLRETVGVMGTAITTDQLRQLGTQTKEVILALDADRAGREAMLRAQRVGGAGTLRLRVADMPAGTDPAEMLAEKGGVERLGSLVDRAEDLGAFHLRKICDDADLSTPEGRDRALDECVPVLVRMGESITRDEAIKALADRLGTEVGLVKRRLETASTEGADQPATGERPQIGERRDGGGAEPADDAVAEATRRASPRQRRERWILVIGASMGKGGPEALARADAEWFDGEVEKRAKAWLEKHPEDPTSGLPDDDPDLVALILQVVDRAERGEADESALEVALAQLEMAAVDEEIQAAQQRDGFADDALLRRRAELSDRIAARL